MADNQQLPMFRIKTGPGAPETQSRYVDMPSEEEAARNRLAATLESDEMTYGRLAEQLEVSKGVLWRFINDPDYEPRDNEIRKKLGLREIIKIRSKRNHLGRFSK